MSQKPMQRASLSQLVDLFNLEEQLYRLLLRLTEVQVEAIQARATPEEFFFLSEKKSVVLHTIERVDRCIGPLKAQYFKQAENNHPADRDRLNRVLDQILDLMDEISSNERSSRELLQRWQAQQARAGRRQRTILMPGFQSAARIRAQVRDSIS